MNHIKLFEAYIAHQSTVNEIKELSTGLKLYEIYSTLTSDEIILWDSLNPANVNLNEGLLDKLRNKIKELRSKKTQISGEGSRKQKQEVQAVIDAVKDKLDDVKQKSSNTVDKLQEYEDKIERLRKRIKELDLKIEDDFNGDSSEPGAQRIMDIQEKIREQIKKLRQEMEQVK